MTGNRIATAGRPNSRSTEAESSRTYTLGGLIEGLPQLTIGFSRGRMQPRSQQLRERAKYIGIHGHLRSRQDDVTVFPPTRISPTQITKDQDVDVQVAIAEAGCLSQAAVALFQRLEKVQHRFERFRRLQRHHQIEKIRATKTHRLAFEYPRQLQFAVARRQRPQASLQMQTRLAVASQPQCDQRHVSLLLNTELARLPRSTTMPTSSAVGTAA